MTIDELKKIALKQNGFAVKQGAVVRINDGLMIRKAVRNMLNIPNVNEIEKRFVAALNGVPGTEQTRTEDIPDLIRYIRLMEEAIFKYHEESGIDCPVEYAAAPATLEGFRCGYDIFRTGSPVEGDYYEEHHCRGTEGDRTCNVLYFLASLQYSDVHEIDNRRVKSLAGIKKGGAE